tara:strand:- start:282 stop:527 length:246 start_codon:yes stop_codon:yes gene_type:complete
MSDKKCCKKKKQEEKFQYHYDINTFQCVDNETYIRTKSEGEDVTLIFDTIELLEWLDIPYMRDQAIIYIKGITGDAENLKE